MMGEGLQVRHYIILSRGVRDHREDYSTACDIKESVDLSSVCTTCTSDVALKLKDQNLINNH